MKCKKLVSSVLAGAMAGVMVLSMSGCSLLHGSGSKVGRNKLKEFAEEAGAVAYDDTDEFIEVFIEEDAGQNAKKIKKGGVIDLEGKDLKSFLKNSDVHGAFNIDLGYEKTMTAGTAFVRGEYNQNSETWAFIGMSIDFESADDAADYFDDIADKIDEIYDSVPSSNDTDTDDGEENGIAYFIATSTNSANDITISEGVYQNGKSVLIVVALDRQTDEGGETLCDFCEALGIECPAEL